MAIRKFRKGMKPFVWVITIIFVLSSAVLYFSSVKGGPTAKIEDVAFNVNGVNVPKIAVERIKADIAKNYSQAIGNSMERELLDVIGIDEILRKQLTLELADKLKVKVSSSEVNTEYKAIRDSFENDDNFIKALGAQGLTRTTLKQELKEQLKISKVFGSIDDNEYQLKIAEMKNNMLVKNIAEEYVNFMPKIVKEIEGIKVSNVDVAKNIILTIASNSKRDAILPYEQAKQIADKNIEAQVKLINEAIASGIEVKEYLPLDQKLAGVKTALYNKYRDEEKITDEELLGFFNANKEFYNREASVDADLVVLESKPTKEDMEQARINAEKLLKEVTVENFAQKAKEFSKDSGSEMDGGDLGWFTKTTMVKEFAEAAFKGNVGEIYPELVETQFGYHIIFVKDKRDNNGVEEVSAAHILLIPEPSENTKEKAKKESQELLTKLSEGKIELSKVKDKYKNVLFAENVKKINESGYIPGIGFLENLTKEIFAGELNKNNIVEENGYIFIYKKTAEVKKEEATLENKEIYDQVLNDYKNRRAAEKLNKIIK